jgi:hypothetical protein
MKMNSDAQEGYVVSDSVLEGYVVSDSVLEGYVVTPLLSSTKKVIPFSLVNMEQC